MNLISETYHSCKRREYGFICIPRLLNNYSIHFSLVEKQFNSLRLPKKYVIPSSHRVVGFNMNLISRTHHLCEKVITHLFIVLDYLIITRH